MKKNRLHSYSHSKIRWAVLLMLVLILTNIDSAYSLPPSKITLKLENVTLDRVLKAIDRQTQYNIIYNQAQVSQYTNISVNIDAEDINEALRNCLRATNLSFEIKNNSIVIIPSVPTPQPQQVKKDHVVKGVVTNSDGKPLSFVTIVLKGTTIGVATNEKGEYTLTVPVAHQNPVLLISMIGYKPMEEAVNNKTIINVALSEMTSKIDNVIVTGYFNRRKDSFTGSAIAVTGEELKKVSNGNILRALSVYDPSFKIGDNISMGSNPNALPDFKIRGTSAIGLTELNEKGELNKANLKDNPNTPTFILDGYEVGIDKIFDMDMERIESITIMKDAAATAIYGSRAANGVVVIKTITPKEGKLMVSYKFNSIITMPDLTGYDLLNAREKLDLEYKSGLYTSAHMDMQQNLDLEYNYKRGLVESGVDTYWLSQPLRVAFNQKHSLYVEGGSPAVRYGVDFRYQSDKGVMKESARNRGGLGFSLAYNLNDKFRIRNSLSIDKVMSTESPYGSFSQYALQNPYYPFKDQYGNMLKKQFQYIAQTDQLLNPLYEATLGNKNESRYTEIADNIDLEWNISKNLRLRGNVAYRERVDNIDKFISPESEQYNKYEYTSGEGFLQRGEGYYYTSSDYSIDANLILTYSQGFGKHFINAALGGNVRESSTKDVNFSTYGYPSGDLNYISFARKFYTEAPGGTQGKSRLAGALVSVNYSYDNRYLADFSARLDGSSQFGSEQRYAPFYAGGLGWNIHNEPFMKSLRDNLSMFKIRAAYGITGKASFSPYQSQTMFQYLLAAWYPTGIGSELMALGNPNLKWELTRKTDMGVDMVILNDRLSITANYYIANTESLLSDITLPTSTGFRSYKENVGEMQNRGYELLLRGVVLKHKDLYLALFANMAHNENKINKISNALKSYNEKVSDEQLEQKYDELGWPVDNLLQTRPLLRYHEGTSTTAIYAMRSLGIDPASGREIYLRRDGSRTYTWDPRENVICGDAESVLTGSFGLNASYKNFNFNMSFQYRLGGDIYNTTLLERVENANLWKNVDRRVYEQRWMQPGDNTFFKDIRNTDPTPATSRFIQEENTLSFNSLSISYDINKSLLKRIGFQTVRIEAQMNDLFRISTVKRERGLDYPFARSIQLGVYVQF